MSVTLIQIDRKIELIDIASRLTSISLPVGTPNEKIMSQLEQWYQTLNQTCLPDETIFTSPTLPVPDPKVNPTVISQNPANAIAGALAPALAQIPGPAGVVASGVANAIANAPLQLTSSPIATK